MSQNRKALETLFMLGNEIAGEASKRNTMPNKKIAVEFLFKNQQFLWNGHVVKYHGDSLCEIVENGDEFLLGHDVMVELI